MSRTTPRVQWVFPMAGRGERVRTLGDFKPFIEVGGVPAWQWFVRSVKGHVRPGDRLVAVTTAAYAENYAVAERLQAVLTAEGIGPRLDLVVCPDTPPGPGASVLQARDRIEDALPLVVANPDQVIDFAWRPLEERQGFLPVYAEFGQKSSYVQMEGDRIVRVVEKTNISHLASAGVYACARAGDLLAGIEELMAAGQTSGGEVFVGPAMNGLIARGYLLAPAAVRTKFDLGSPDGIAAFAVHADAMGITGAKGDG